MNGNELINREIVYESLDDTQDKIYFTKFYNIFLSLPNPDNISFINFLVGLSYDENKLIKFSKQVKYKKEVIENIINSVKDIIENKDEIENDYEILMISKLSIVTRIQKKYNIDIDTILDVFIENGYNDYDTIKEVNDIIGGKISNFNFEKKFKDFDEGLFEIFESISGKNIIRV